MHEGLSKWETIRVVKEYQQLPYDLTVAFNPTTSMLRIQLSGVDTTMSKDVGKLPANSNFPGLRMVEALRSRQVKLGFDMEASIRKNAIALLSAMEGHAAVADDLNEDKLMPFFNRLAEDALRQTYQAFEAVGGGRHQPSAPQMK